MHSSGERKQIGPNTSAATDRNDHDDSNHYSSHHNRRGDGDQISSHYNDNCKADHNNRGTDYNKGNYNAARPNIRNCLRD